MSEPNALLTFGTGLLSGLTVGVVGTVLSRTGLRRPRVRVHKAPFLDDGTDQCWWVNIVQGLMGGKATVTHIWVETSGGDAEILSPDLPWSFEPGGPGCDWGIPVAVLPDEDLTEKFRAHTTTSSSPLKSKYREPIRPAGSSALIGRVTRVVWAKGVPPGVMTMAAVPTTSPPPTGVGPQDLPR